MRNRASGVVLRVPGRRHAGFVTCTRPVGGAAAVTELATFLVNVPECKVFKEAHLTARHASEAQLAELAELVFICCCKYIT